MGLFGNKRDKSVVKGEKSEYHSSGKGPRPPPSSSMGGGPMPFYDPYGQMLGQHKFGLYPSLNKSPYGIAPNPFDPQQQQQQQQAGAMLLPPQASLQAQANAIFQMQQQQGGGGGYPGMSFAGHPQVGGGQGVMGFGGASALSSPYFDGNNYFASAHQPSSLNAGFAPYQGLNFSDPNTAAALGGAFAAPYGYMPAGY